MRRAVACMRPGTATPPPSEQEHALPAHALVEQPVGLLGSVQGPTVGVQLADVDPLGGDEGGALGLAGCRERPRPQGVQIAWKSTAI